VSKRILLIGNGPSALDGEGGGLGARIDAFDGVVARFNEYRIDGYEARVGTRIDEWITWRLFPQQAAREYDRVLCTAQPPADTWPEVRRRYPHARMVDPRAVDEATRRMGYELPSSGAIVAVAYAMEGYEVVLHGFDFFQGDRHHYADNADPGPRHSPSRELILFAGLIREGRVGFLDERRAEAFAALLADEPRRVAEAVWAENRKLLERCRQAEAARTAAEEGKSAAWHESQRLLAERDRAGAEAARLARVRDEQAAKLNALAADLEATRRERDAQAREAARVAQCWDQATARLLQAEAARDSLWSELQNAVRGRDEALAESRRIAGAWDQATARLLQAEATRDSLWSELQGAVRARDEALAEARRLADEARALADRLAAQIDELAQSRAVNEDLRRDLAAAEESIRSLHRRMADLADAVARHARQPVLRALTWLRLLRPLQRDVLPPEPRAMPTDRPTPTAPLPPPPPGPRPVTNPR
jgi:hypothetical protein